jgi:6-phosphogluconate dehydrogenase
VGYPHDEELRACRYMSALKPQRVAAEKFYADLGLGGVQPVTGDKAKLISDVKDALYAAKICSYAQV